MMFLALPQGLDYPAYFQALNGEFIKNVECSLRAIGPQGLRDKGERRSHIIWRAAATEETLRQWDGIVPSHKASCMRSAPASTIWRNWTSGCLHTPWIEAMSGHQPGRLRQ